MSQTTGMTKTDAEKLADYIAELNTLKETWEGKTDKPVDVGECGGKMITEIEALGEVVMDAREAFVHLLEQTISYMNGRKESLETQDEQAKEAILEVAAPIAGVTAAIQPTIN